MEETTCDELIPATIECADGALIREVFGSAFYVVDQTGQPLATRRNQRLLRYAKVLVAKSGNLRRSERKRGLSRLATLADDLSAESFPFPHGLGDFDSTHSAGSLE